MRIKEDVATFQFHVEVLALVAEPYLPTLLVSTIIL